MPGTGQEGVNVKVLDDSNPKRLKVVTDAGVHMVVKPVKRQTLQNLLVAMNADELFNKRDRAALEKAVADEVMADAKAVAASLALFNYIAAYGVEVDIPEDEARALVMLGLASDNPKVIQSVWVYEHAFARDEEAGELLAVVIAITGNSTNPAVPVEHVKTSTE